MRQILTTGTRGNPKIDTLSVDSIAYLSQVVETANIIGTAISASTTINVSSGSIYYYGTDATANWTVNITDTVSLDATMSTGQSMTVVLIVKQGSTARYNTAVTVDGTARTTNWLTGAAPTQGTVDGLDVYSYTVIKLGTNSFVVLASLSNYA